MPSLPLRAFAGFCCCLALTCGARADGARSESDTVLEVERFRSGGRAYRVETRSFAAEGGGRAFDLSVFRDGARLFRRRLDKGGFAASLSANADFSRRAVLFDLKRTHHVAERGCFVFRAHLGVGATDNVTECFIVLDERGRTLLQDISYGFCVESVRLSPNRRYLVTCKGIYDLLSMSRMHKHFDKRGNVVLAAVLADSAYTVVYDYWDEEAAGADNAFIYDFDHQVVHQFRFDGYYDALQYQALFDQSEELRAVGYFDYPRGLLRVYGVPDLGERVYKLTEVTRFRLEPSGRLSLDFSGEDFASARFFFDGRGRLLGYYIARH